MAFSLHQPHHQRMEPYDPFDFLAASSADFFPERQLITRKNVNRNPHYDSLFAPINYFPFGPLARMNGELSGPSMNEFAPILSADMVESETDYHVSVDLPGVKKEDLDITFTNGYMVIKAERTEVQESDKLTIHKVERKSGKVQRSIALPRNADSDKAVATLKEGVLTVSLPKKEVTKSVKLVVNNEEEGQVNC